MAIDLLTAVVRYTNDDASLNREVNRAARRIERGLNDSTRVRVRVRPDADVVRRDAVRLRQAYQRELSRLRLPRLSNEQRNQVSFRVRIRPNFRLAETDARRFRQVYQRALRGIRIRPDAALVRRDAVRLRHAYQSELRKLRLPPLSRPGGGGFGGGGVGGFGGLATTAGLGILASQIGRISLEAAQATTTVRQLSQGFDALALSRNIDGDALLGDVQRAARNTLTQQQALSIGARALATGIAPLYENLGQVLTDVADVAVLYGRNVAESQERVISAIQKGEQELLDEFGVVVRADQAYREYAGSIGKAQTELTTLEKQTAFATATIRAFADQAEASGRLYSGQAESIKTVSQALGELNVQYRGLQTALGETVEPAAVDAIQAVNYELNITKQLIADTRGFFARLLGAPTSQFRDFVNQLDNDQIREFRELTIGSTQTQEGLALAVSRSIGADFIQNLEDWGKLTQVIEQRYQKIIAQQNALLKNATEQRKAAQEGFEVAAEADDKLAEIGAGLTVDPIVIDVEVSDLPLDDVDVQLNALEEKIKTALDVSPLVASQLEALSRITPQAFERAFGGRLEAFERQQAQALINQLPPALRAQLDLSAFTTTAEETETQVSALDNALQTFSHTIADSVADLALGEFRFKIFIRNLLSDITRQAIEARTDGGLGGALSGVLTRALGSGTQVANQQKTTINVGGGGLPASNRTAAAIQRDLIDRP